MRSIVEFCAENDPYKPDFLGKMIGEGIIRRECTPNEDNDNAKMNSHEKQLLQNQVHQYYKENWASVILIIMRYKNPLIANVNQISSLSEELDANQEIYFHIDWLKPGRHVYAIEHTIGEVAEDDDHAAEVKKL